MQHVRNLKSATALTALLSFLQRAGYRFITPTPATHARNNSRAGNEQARRLTDAFGWSRPFPGELLPQALLDRLKDGAVIFESDGGWKSSVRVSTLGDDLFLHSAFPTVESDAVFFGPDTYRFARAIRQTLGPGPRRLRRVLDLGCGSGAGGVVLARHASCGEVVLTDINDAALQMARLNADAAGLHNVTTARSDLFADVEGDFDFIIANPPYLNDPLQRTYRHGGGELGSALSIRIAREAKHRLAAGGTLLLYTGSPILGGVDRLQQALAEAFAGDGLRCPYEEIDPDVFGEELETEAYSHVERIAAVLFTARKRGADEC
jgi:release factor glutamine methyltransferase